MNTNDDKILHLYHQGMEIKEIIQKTGLSRSKVYQVIHNEKNGISPDYQKRGRKKGEKRILTPEQQHLLYEKLITTKPDDYSFPDVSTRVWTRKNIQALVGTYDIQISDHTVGNYLKRFGLQHSRPDFKINSGMLYIAVINLNANNQVSNKIQVRAFSKGMAVYMVFAYDKRGTYYFCVYDENTFAGTNNATLARIHDFLTRMPKSKQYQHIFCEIPKNNYLKSFVKLWHENKEYNRIYDSSKIEFRIKGGKL